uniref:HMG box-containing protein 4 n=1 Tax=Geotrypetes seraphini TaxID=260995 RepID=A0A6P8QFA7_GEOSA|nr:HMG domain-containing protein 4 isoform X2 [Geotrypetes seraphini]
MAYDDSRKKEEYLDNDRGIDEPGLVAGRSQREKKRSYKDLLREEEEIAAQDSELFFVGTDVHKKKKKHSSEDFYYPDFSPLELSAKKKKKVVINPSTDTAMDILKAITSPSALSSKPSKKTEKSSFGSSGFSAHSEGKKEHRKEHRKMHSEVSHSSEDVLHKSKKSKLPFLNTETLTLREPDGLKMKLILSPKEKGGTEEEAFPYPGPPTQKKSSSKKALREDQATFLLAHELSGFTKSARKKPKTESHLAEDFGSEASFYADAPGFDLTGLETMDTGSSSGGELEAGELVIDDCYREVKKKKKSKKSKKKKEKHREKKHREEKHREEKHSKSKKGLSLSSGEAGTVVPVSGSNVQPANSVPYTLPSPTPPPPVFHSEVSSEKKKKKEEKEREKTEKLEKPKKKNMSAYQVFCKEYRINIVADHPGIDFGELSKKLAEVWKQLPEKEKLVWKQKAQYIQHKQNKAEATTVKRKPSALEAVSKVKGIAKVGQDVTEGKLQASWTQHVSSSDTASHKAGVMSPHKKSPSSSMTVSSSPAKVPETDPIDVAAHLQLLGESLSLIGHRLQETEGMVAVSGSLSVLLDSIICALGPLACLTAQVPQLNGCPKQVLSNTLDNIAYIMPGL